MEVTKPYELMGFGAMDVTKHYEFTLGFFIHGFWAGRKSQILGVWTAPRAPAAPKVCQKVGGEAPLVSWPWYPRPPIKTLGKQKARDR